MATIIDALAVTLGLNARDLTREAVKALEKVRSDASALLEAAAADFDLKAFAGNPGAISAGLWQMALDLRASAEWLSSWPKALGFLPGVLQNGGNAGDRTDGSTDSPAWSRIVADFHPQGSVQTAELSQEKGVGDRLSSLRAEELPERRWQNALLALGSLKVLSATSSLPGLAVALEAAVGSFDAIRGDSDVTGLAALSAAGRAAGGIALLTHGRDMPFFESKDYAGERAAGLAATFQEQGDLDPRTASEDGNAQGSGEWSPSRQADFKRAFGVDIRQSSAEQQLAFADWESNNAMLTARERLVGIETPRQTGVAMTRYFGFTQSEDADADAEAGQPVAATESIYGTVYRDDLERGGAAAASMALAAQSGPSIATGSTTATGSSTSETHIHGPITLVTQATDGAGLALEFAGMGRSQSLVQQGNTGIF